MRVISRRHGLEVRRYGPVWHTGTFFDRLESNPPLLSGPLPYRYAVGRRAGTKKKLGANQQAPKAPRLRRRRRRWERYGEGVSPPHPTRGSGERRELPQRGLGRSPGAKRIWCILMPSRGRWLQRFTKFCSVSSNAELRILHKHRQHT